MLLNAAVTVREIWDEIDRVEGKELAEKVIQKANDDPNFLEALELFTSNGDFEIQGVEYE